MSFFNWVFHKRKSRKQEINADEQYLDAIEIIKESMDIYLELLAQARQNSDEESCKRLEEKLNSEFNYQHKSWNGTVSIVHTVEAFCTVELDKKCLRLK